MINNYLPRFFYWCWDSNPYPLRSQLSMEVRLPWIRPLACRMVAVSVRCLGSPGWCPAQEGRSARHDRSQQLGEVRIYFNTTIIYVTCINLSLKAKPANKILNNLSYFKYYCLFYGCVKLSSKIKKISTDHPPGPVIGRRDIEVICDWAAVCSPLLLAEL